MRLLLLSLRWPHVQPWFVRALLRRARAFAFEAIGKYDMAMQDVQDLQSRSSSDALGAYAVRGAPNAGIGPCLPARPVSKKGAIPTGGLVASGVQWRPLKLIYDHDIRLGRMPVNCTFEVLRDIVSKSFPSSKLVLIKYKDDDGDLVTITCTAELRLAESSADNLLPKEPDADKTDTTGKLRLHIVEVSPEQEPSLLQEEERNLWRPKGIRETKVSHSSLRESVMETDDIEIDKSEKEAPKRR
ncbi:hypothetical protein GH714_020941 [Hevea brasiliensis]|uniref:PB1 domain-containing protein n=1 Tax=Hevea brasiliensis TaxID=3981 RepID=A0A6A6LB62_HEVBR|nr:hypothetical protein GH714_020941 [Hevea brasiliensis]